MSTEFVLIPKKEYQRLKDHPAASNKEKKSPELPVKRLVVAGKKEAPPGVKHSTKWMSF